MQASTIKAMEITDSASGKLMVQYPGKMRWVYKSPEEQIIVSDGEHLWIYRPEDNQVLRGMADAFFGDGKGAGFLSDIRRIREDFNITLEDIRFGDFYRLMINVELRDVEQLHSLMLTLEAESDVAAVERYRDREKTAVAAG